MYRSLLVVVLTVLWFASAFASYNIGLAVGQLMGATEAYLAGVKDGEMSNHFNCKENWNESPDAGRRPRPRI